MNDENKNTKKDESYYPSSGYPGESYPHEGEFRRFATLHLENSTLHKVCDCWFLEVAKVLREYADAVERGETGNHATGIFDSEGGTRIVITNGTWNGAKKPTPGIFVRQEQV